MNRTRSESTDLSGTEMMSTSFALKLSRPQSHSALQQIPITASPYQNLSVRLLLMILCLYVAVKIHPQSMVDLSETTEQILGVNLALPFTRIITSATEVYVDTDVKCCQRPAGLMVRRHFPVVKIAGSSPASVDFLGLRRSIFLGLSP